MDEETLRERAEAWRRRSTQSLDPRAQAADRLLAAHYAALADLMAARARPLPFPNEEQA